MKKLPIIFLIFISICSFAQKANQNLIDLDKKCANLLESDNYKQLIATATLGINNSKGNIVYDTKFYFYSGYGLEHDNNQYQKAVTDLEKSLKFAKQTNNLEAQTRAIMRLNYLYYSTKEFKKRDDLVLYINKILDTTKNINTQGILNGSLGEYYLDKSEYENFIKYKIKAIEYRKKFPKTDLNNLDNIGISFEQIASGYIKMKQFDKAIEYTNYAKPYINNSVNGLAYLCNYYIQCYVALNQNDSIQSYYNQINKLVSPKDSLHINISFANRLMADYYLNNKKINIAHDYAQKAIKIAYQSNDEEILMEANMILGMVQYEKKDFVSAIKTLNAASQHALDYDKEHFTQINKVLSKSYAAVGDWQNAYKFNNIYCQNNDELQRQYAKQSIANAEAKFQNKSKQEKISELSTQNTINNLKIVLANKQKIYFIFGLILLAIIGGLLFYQSKNRQKTNQKLQVLNSDLDQANKTKARFFSILNHDLRSPVYNLMHFLQLQKESPEFLDETSKNEIQATTLTSVENLLGSMEDMLLWSKGQMENFKPQPENILVSKIFDDTSKHFSSEGKIKINFENPENIEILTDGNYLKTIVRNLTGNAIKALSDIDNPMIVWKAWQTQDKEYLSITDNGSGADNEDFKALYDDKEIVGIKTGLGLHLIRDLAKAIDCEISVDSNINNGTTFTLKIRK